MKSFDKESFLRNDKLGRGLLIAYYKYKYNIELVEYKVADHERLEHLLVPDGYKTDLLCPNSGAFIEVEITNSWKSGEFPKHWGPKTIWERKIKYIDSCKVIFWNINNALTHAWWCRGEDLTIDNLKPSGKVPGELWYEIPENKARKVEFDSDFIKNYK
jgi:hypothetical protein